MKKSSVLALLITNGFAYYGIYLVPYIHTYFYDATVEALGMTNAQFGLLASIGCFVTIIGYTLGGLVADKFDTKKLMITAYIVQIATMIAYSTFPPLGTVIVVQIFSALVANMLYWGAMSKYVRSLGDPTREARLYGLHFAFVGIGGSVMGLLIAGLIGAFGSATGLRLGLYINSAVAILAIIINLILYKPQKVEISEDEKFKFSNVFAVLKMPNFWLVAIVAMCLYSATIMMSYAAPMLRSNFGVPLVIVSMIGTFRSFLARVICAPVGGTIIDKTNSSVNFMRWLTIACLICAITMLLIPWNSSSFIIAAIIVIVLCLIYNLSVPTWFTPLTDIKIPNHMRGTAVGLLSALAFSPDAYAYALAGRAIDSMGDHDGYIAIYSVLVAVFLIGIVASIILSKRIKKLSTETDA